MHEAANFFDEIADAQIAAPVKRKLTKAEERSLKARAAERELKDEQKLGKLYRRWRREKRDALLNDPHGAAIADLLSFMAGMTLDAAPALIERVRAAGWIRDLSADQRFDLLFLIGNGIASCRVRHGLTPFEDEIPWTQAPKAFAQIKTILGLDGQ